MGAEQELRDSMNQPAGDTDFISACKDYSGFVILRFKSKVPIIEAGDLLEMIDRFAEKGFRLEGLREMLEAHDFPKTERVVTSLSVPAILALEEEAMSGDLPPLHSLASYWRIDLREHALGLDQEMIEQLTQLEFVDVAYAELSACDPSNINADPEPFILNQGYLNPAPEGIDARWVWEEADEGGAGITFVDLEQGWILSHQELTNLGVTPPDGGIDNRDQTQGYSGDHGTAVLGMVLARDNGIGVIGIAPRVTSTRVVSHFRSADSSEGHVADAIASLLPDPLTGRAGLISAGDVLLLEVQRGPGDVPTEVDDKDFDAIRLASSRGIIVVEAAGNGDNDLDAILTRMDPNTNLPADSGAIMVGAARSDLPHARWPLSNFGARVNCYGWGENVVTTGYGNLGTPGSGAPYTGTFNGTSSAAAVIAGAALLVQGKFQADHNGQRLVPFQMRNLLSSPETGTPQGGDISENIGVMPNLQALLMSINF